MKVHLRVLSAGKMQGKSIQVVQELLIGRDASCQLRPSSPLISGRHCRIWLHDGKVIVEDLGSTNGTTVRGARISSPSMLQTGDELQVGPLQFVVEISHPVAEVAKKTKSTSEDDLAADLLLAMGDEPPPMGSTIMMSKHKPQNESSDTPPPANKEKADEPTKSSSTSNAASAILGKHMRRRT